MHIKMYEIIMSIKKERKKKINARQRPKDHMGILGKSQLSCFKWANGA